MNLVDNIQEFAGALTIKELDQLVSIRRRLESGGESIVKLGFVSHIPAAQIKRGGHFALVIYTNGELKEWDP